MLLRLHCRSFRDRARARTLASNPGHPSLANGNRSSNQSVANGWLTLLIPPDFQCRFTLRQRAPATQRNLGTVRQGPPGVEPGLPIRRAKMRIDETWVSASLGSSYGDTLSRRRGHPPHRASRRVHYDTSGVVIGAVTFVVRTADLLSRVAATAMEVGPGESGLPTTIGQPIHSTVRH